MRIDLNKYPECTNWCSCHTSGILNTQESETSHVIAVTSLPVSSGPVQVLGHDSPVVGSTSTSYPVQALVHDSAAVGSTSTSFPAQYVPSMSSYGAFMSPSQRPAFQAPVQATSASGASATSTSSTSSPFHSSSSFRLRSAPTQALGPAIFQTTIVHSPVQVNSDSGASATSISSPSSPFHSYSLFGPAPAFTSVSSAPTQALGPTTFGFGAFSAPTPPRFGTMQDPGQATASSTSTSFRFVPAHNFGQPDPVQVNSDSGASATSIFSTSPPLHSYSLFGPAPAFTSVSSAPMQALGPTTFGFGAFSAPTQPRFGTMQDPVQATASSTSTSFSFVPAHNFGQPDSASVFGNSVAFARPDVGISTVPSSSTTTAVSGTSPVSVSPPFGLTEASVQASTSSTSTFLPFGCIPASPESGYDSTYPGYRPTADGQTQYGDTYVSISASNPYQHKSHEELRWEDYKQGVKGGSFPPAYVSPIGSRPDAVFSPSLFDSRSIGTTGVFRPFPAAGGVTTPSSSDFHQTNVVYSSNRVQRPHETAAVYSAAPGCTACGATTSSSASCYYTLNGATTPPSAARYLLGYFFPISSGSMMFGTTLSDQVTTPAPEAYPVEDYILLPLTALSQQ